MATDCNLQQLDNGLWWCPVCDPGKKYLCKRKTRRNCGTVGKAGWSSPRVPAEDVVSEKHRGPGDYLHNMILRWTGEGMTLGCDCKAWIARMNDWGPAGCLQHIDEIVAHMLSEAKKRGWKLTGMPGAKTVVGLAVRRACRMAEKAEAARAN